MSGHPTIALLWELLTKGRDTIPTYTFLENLSSDAGLALVLKSSKEATPLSHVDNVEKYLSTELGNVQNIDFQTFKKFCIDVGDFKFPDSNTTDQQTEPIEQRENIGEPKISIYSQQPLNSDKRKGSQPKATSRGQMHSGSTGLPALLYPQVRDSIVRGAHDVDDEDLYKDIIQAAKHVEYQVPFHEPTKEENKDTIGTSVGEGHTIYQHPYVNLDALDNTTPLPRSVHQVGGNSYSISTPASSTSVETNARNARMKINSASSQLPSSSLYLPSFPVEKIVHSGSQDQLHRTNGNQNSQHVEQTQPMGQHPQSRQTSQGLTPNEIFLHYLIRKQANEIESLKTDYESLKQKAENDLLEERAMAEEAIHRLKSSHQEQLSAAQNDMNYIRESCTFLQRLLKDMRKEHGANRNGRRAATELIDQMLTQLGNNQNPPSNQHVLPNLPTHVQSTKAQSGSQSIAAATRTIGYARTLSDKAKSIKSIRQRDIANNITSDNIGGALAAKSTMKMQKLSPIRKNEKVEDEGKWVPSLQSPSSPVTTAMKKLWVFQQAHFA